MQSGKHKPAQPRGNSAYAVARGVHVARSPGGLTVLGRWYKTPKAAACCREAIAIVHMRWGRHWRGKASADARSRYCTSSEHRGRVALIRGEAPASAIGLKSGASSSAFRHSGGSAPGRQGHDGSFSTLSRGERAGHGRAQGGCCRPRGSHGLPPVCGRRGSHAWLRDASPGSQHAHRGGAGSPLAWGGPVPRWRRPARRDRSCFRDRAGLRRRRGAQDALRPEVQRP